MADFTYTPQESPISGLLQGAQQGAQIAAIIGEQKQYKQQQARQQMVDGLSLMREGWVPKDYKIMLYNQNVKPFFQGSKVPLPDLQEWPDFGDKAAKELNDIVVNGQKKGLPPQEIETMAALALAKYEPDFAKRGAPVLEALRAETTAQTTRDVVGIKSQASAKGADTMRKEFINRPEVKDFVTISTQVKSMDALMKSATGGNMENKVALDQALVSMYNKLTDPTSVVRESEFARTGENLPMVNRIVGAVEKVAAGGAGLTDKDREALVAGAKIIANERGKQYNQTRSGYADLSTKLGYDPTRVVGTIPSFEEYNTGANGQALPTGAVTAPAPTATGAPAQVGRFSVKVKE